MQVAKPVRGLANQALCPAKEPHEPHPRLVPHPHPTGFVLHLSATPRNLHATRGLVSKILCDAGVNPDLTDSVQLVLSELYGNAVRACGDFVPLVAELEVEPPPRPSVGAPGAVWVRLHDPYRDTRPRRTGIRLDDPEAESGRGLPIVDLLAPGWDVTATPVGKQVRCRVPFPGN